MTSKAGRPSRRLRARQRAVATQCRPIALAGDADGHPRWLVASTSAPGAAYQVTGRGDVFACPCPAGARGLPCCHAAAVELLLHPDLTPLPSPPRAPRRQVGMPEKPRRRRDLRAALPSAHGETGQGTTLV